METLTERIKRHEGLRLNPYTDSTNHISIGWGRNLTDKGITENEANEMLAHDIAEAERDLQDLTLDFRYNLDLVNAVRQGVLVEMIFQLGFPGFLGFKKMLAALEVGDFKEASQEMLRSLWARQTPKRAKELSEIMCDGH